MRFWNSLLVLLLLSVSVSCGPEASVPAEKSAEASVDASAGKESVDRDTGESTPERIPEPAVEAPVTEPTASDSTEPAAPDSAEPVTPDAGEPSPPEASNPPEGKTELGKAVDSAMTAELKKQGLIGLAVAVVKDGKLVYSNGYGYADREKKIPVDASKTMFRWASISKTLAGVVAVKLRTQGKLDLDKSIENYVTDYKVPTEYAVPCSGSTATVNGKSYPCNQSRALVPLTKAQQKITSRWLSCHLGGIAHYTNGWGNPTPLASEANDPKKNTGIEWAVKKYLYPKPLVKIPGAAYSYTTFGFNLLGVVLEKAAKATFASQVDSMVTQPAGMTTLQPDYEWKKIPNRAVGYRKLGTTITQDGSSDVSWKLPGGGFISTVRDMALYCQSLADSSILSPAEKALAWTRQKTTGGRSINYGIGFALGSRNGRSYIGHSGSQQKTLTQLRLYPKEGLCVVLMTNSTYAKSGTLRNVLEDTVRKF